MATHELVYSGLTCGKQSRESRSHEEYGQNWPFNYTIKMNKWKDMCNIHNRLDGFTW